MFKIVQCYFMKDGKNRAEFRVREPSTQTVGLKNIIFSGLQKDKFLVTSFIANSGYPSAINLQKKNFNIKVIILGDE